MRARFLALVVPVVSLFAFLPCTAVAWQDGESYPRLPYRLDAGFLKLPEGWNLGETSGVTINSQGHIFVFNRGPHELIEFNTRGDFVRTIGDGLFTRPHGLRIDDQDNLWITDRGGHTVVRFNPQGRVTLVLGRKDEAGESDRLFDGPADVASGPNGEIFVADGYGNSRVVKFDRNGNYIKAWGRPGTRPGEFNLVHTVRVGPDRRLYVGDRENRRIQIFDLDGNFIEQWTHVGSPWGLEITDDRVIYMTDGYADRVLKLDLEGKVLGSLGESGKAPGQFMYAHWIAVGPSEELYVSEILNWRVQRFVVGETAAGSRR